MRTLYIIKTGNTFPAIAQQHGDFEDWIATGLYPEQILPAERLPLAIINAQMPSAGSAVYPHPNLCAGVVISGSHDMVTDQMPWMLDLQQWLHQVCHAGIPVLGICFGHQMLAQTLGGKVGKHPAGLEIGTVPVAIQTDVANDPLWKHMPSCFDAHTVHYQSVQHLPSDACALAGNSHESHHAFRWRNNVWGVQFHPEFSAAAMQGYIDHLANSIDKGETTAPLRSIATPDAAQLLYYFGVYARQFAQQTQTQQLAA